MYHEELNQGQLLSEIKTMPVYRWSCWITASTPYFKDRRTPRSAYNKITSAVHTIHNELNNTFRTRRQYSKEGEKAFIRMVGCMEVAPSCGRYHVHLLLGLPSKFYREDSRLGGRIRHPSVPVSKFICHWKRLIKDDDIAQIPLSLKEDIYDEELHDLSNYQNKCLRVENTDWFFMTGRKQCISA